MEMRHLHGFTHISTAYVNCAHPAGSHIEECFYPLGTINGTPLDHRDIAEKFAALNKEEAEEQVRHASNRFVQLSSFLSRSKSHNHLVLTCVLRSSSYSLRSHTYTHKLIKLDKPESV